jgi:hypothetical protein
VRVCDCTKSVAECVREAPRVGSKVFSLCFVFPGEAEEKFWWRQEAEKRKEVRLGGDLKSGPRCEDGEQTD